MGWCRGIYIWTSILISAPRDCQHYFVAQCPMGHKRCSPIPKGMEIKRFSLVALVNRGQEKRLSSQSHFIHPDNICTPRALLGQ
ncbi:MAG: hypothetical protein ACRDDN_07735, partial [Aeromonas veronii]